MARSLKVAGCLLLITLLPGCGHLLPTKTKSQRFAAALTTQQRAEAAYNANDMPHAAALYMQLTKAFPREADYWYMLGNTYVRMDNPDHAVQAYQQALTRNPEHARAWHNLGIVRMRQALSAFASSASTANEGDPLHEVSARLADELAHVGSNTLESKNQAPANQAPAVAQVPVSVSNAAAPAESPARRRPGTPVETNQP